MAMHWILPERFDTYDDGRKHSACGKLHVEPSDVLDPLRFTDDPDRATCKDCQRARGAMIGAQIAPQLAGLCDLSRQPEKGERCTIRFNGHYYTGVLQEMRGRRALVRYAASDGLVRERLLPISPTVEALKKSGRAGVAFEGTAPDLSNVLRFAHSNPQGFVSALVNICDTYVEQRTIRRQPQEKREHWILALLEAHDAGEAVER
jgi:hypothetical protein